MPPQIIIKGKEPDKIVTGSQAMAESLLHQVVKHVSSIYPDHPWHVDMTSDYSVIRIRNLFCSQYGYVLHTMDVQNDPSLKCVTMAAGELLERLFLERKGLKNKIPDKIDLAGVKERRLSDYKKDIKDLI
jgi:hypothetical protein